MSISRWSPIHGSRAGRIAGNLAAFVLAAAYTAGTAYAATPSLSISQTPLTVTIPAHPQVIIALGNSQSMDGTLAGAIMTGAGSLGSSYSLLQNSSSPLDFTIPSGFTPPVNPGSGGVAPNTAACPSPYSSYYCDNSPSRLNIAKAAIQSVLTSFMADTEFSLMDYQTSGVSEYETWLYLMSPANGPFEFTGTAGTNTTNNPCYQYTTLSSSSSIYKDCANIASGGQVTVDSGFTLATAPYVIYGASSDDPAINDVLYSGSGGIDPVCLEWGTKTTTYPAGAPSPADPYTYYTLSQYNANPGNLTVGYQHYITNCGNAATTGPTNAGYVPYSPQTMYVARGFGYYGSQTAAPPGSPGYWAPLVTFSQGNAGQNPTPGTISTALAYFNKYLQPETNSTSTGEIKAGAVQSPLPGLLANAYGYFKNANPASSNGCAANRYVILLTDGLPTEDLSGHYWPPAGSTAAAGYGMTASFNSDGSLNTSGTNDQALLDTIRTLTTMNQAGIKTYIVGLGSGVSGSVAASVLTSMAIAGGTSNYFAAQDPNTLLQDLSSILALVQQATQSVSSAAVNSTGIHVGSLAIQAQFTSSDAHQDWTGNLYAFPIDPNTGYVNTNPSSAKWSAQTQLDSLAWNSRMIATWDPAAGAGIPFEWTSGTPTTGIASSTALGTALSSNPADTKGQDALDYLRGDRQLEAATGGPYRTRTHVLGDIVDSAPLYVGPPTGAFLGASYAAFEAKYATRPPIIYVGANDGMLHAFDANTGAERFAFIPHAVFSNLIQLTYPLYNQNHLFYMDGSPEAWNVQFGDGSWHTILVSGEGAGGQSYFALDVTDPAGMTTEQSVANSVLWEFTDSNLGDTFGTPSLATTNAGTFLFFGNGYNSTGGSPYLYAVNPQTGVAAAKINLCSFAVSACNSALPNGLSSVTVVDSSGNMSTANLLYAGDLQGNVWRVDLSNTLPSKWTATLLFKAVDAAGNPQPITTAPLVSLNPDFPRLSGLMVFVGTGQMMTASDLNSTQVQSIYGLYDGMPNASAITRSELVQQTLTAATIQAANGSTINVRSISSNKVAYPTQMGWYIDFSLTPGERVVTQPVLIDGALLFTTNQPSGIACQGGFNSWLYAVNYMNGGLFPAPILDETESGSVSTSQTPVAALSLGNVYASAPRVTTGSLGHGSANLDILINESGNPTSSGAYQSYGSTQGTPCNGPAAVCGDSLVNLLGAGGGHSRTAWWEIR